MSHTPPSVLLALTWHVDLTSIWLRHLSSRLQGYPTNPHIVHRLPGDGIVLLAPGDDIVFLAPGDGAEQQRLVVDGHNGLQRHPLMASLQRVSIMDVRVVGGVDRCRVGMAEEGEEGRNFSQQHSRITWLCLLWAEAGEEGRS